MQRLDKKRRLQLRSLRYNYLCSFSGSSSGLGFGVGLCGGTGSPSFHPGGLLPFDMVILLCKLFPMAWVLHSSSLRDNVLPWLL